MHASSILWWSIREAPVPWSERTGAFRNDRVHKIFQGTHSGIVLELPLQAPTLQKSMDSRQVTTPARGATALPYSSPACQNLSRCRHLISQLPSLFLADFIDNVGSWLSYVATLELVQSFSGGSGLALSAVILIRFFPSLLLSPIAGVLADRCNRVMILVTAAIADAMIVAALVMVRDPSQTPLLFLLLTAQFTAIALQDPSRRAILPVLVPQEDLHLATTLETFSWSLTGAVGAAVGGTIASKLGNSACFLIDAGTYLVAAFFAYKVPKALGDPHAIERGTMKKMLRSEEERIKEKEREGLLSLSTSSGSGGSGGISYQPSVAEVQLADIPNSSHLPAMPHLHDVEHRKHHSNNPLDEVSHGIAVIHSTISTGSAPDVEKNQNNKNKSTRVHMGNNKKSSGTSSHPNGSTKSSSTCLEDVPLISPREHTHTNIINNNHSGASSSLPLPLHGATQHSSTTNHQHAVPAARPLSAGTNAASQTLPAGAPGSQGMLKDALAACLGGWSAAVEGWRYLLAPENRDVAVLVTMKGAGGFTWGAVDVLNVKFSELPNMQISDGATTLGIIFAIVGVGCFLGPVVMNILVVPKPRQLLWACGVSFGFLFAGAVLMAAAKQLSMVLAASLVRSVGSAGMWIYSTLLLQLRCPNAILGRVSAAEMALYTVAEAVSSLYGGAAFDVFGLTLEQTTGSLAVVAGFVFGGWMLYAWRQNSKIEQLSGRRGSGEREWGGSGDEEEAIPLREGL